MPSKSEPSATRQTEELRRLKQSAAARLIGVTARSLRDSDAPRNKDGTYDAHQLVKWFVSKDHPQPGRPERERREAAEAGLAELKLQEKAGELVRRVDIQRNLDAFAQRLRNAVDELARRRNITGQDLQRTINNVLDECEWR